MVRYSKERPLRVFTAFSGYDSQCLALERLKAKREGFEYELVGWSEIEPSAIKAHNCFLIVYDSEKICVKDRAERLRQGGKESL